MKTTGAYDHKNDSISTCMNVDHDKIKAICNKVMRRFIADERSETSRLLEIIIEECDTVDEAVLATYIVNSAFENLQMLLHTL
jgi:hypothetical protein